MSAKISEEENCVPSHALSNTLEDVDLAGACELDAVIYLATPNFVTPDDSPCLPQPLCTQIDRDASRRVLKEQCVPQNTLLSRGTWPSDCWPAHPGPFEHQEPTGRHTR